MRSAPELVVDERGRPIADAQSGTVLGQPGLSGSARMIVALPTNLAGGLSRRYMPAHPAGEQCDFAMSFDAVIPPGVGITAGALEIWTNVIPPVLSSDFSVGPVSVIGRALYATLSGGVDGTDYQLMWTATDTEGNVWPRTGLCLCATTS